MNQPARSKDVRNPPWWLDGDEVCIFCLQTYAIEVQYRCAGCDRGVCPHCVVILRTAGEIICFCTECQAAGEEF